MRTVVVRLLMPLALLLTAVGVSAAGQPVRVVFVDTGNTGRSVAAEALARNLIAATGAPVSVISRAVNLNPYNTGLMRVWLGVPQKRQAKTLSVSMRLDHLHEYRGRSTQAQISFAHP